MNTRPSATTSVCCRFRGGDPVSGPTGSALTYLTPGSKSVTSFGAGIIGHYYIVAAAGVFKLKFDEPVESLNHPSGAGHAFAYILRRIDGSNTVADYHLNVWFDEY